MSIFRTEAAPETTGLDVLRSLARSRQMGLAALAHELGAATHQLEAFIAGGSLAIETCNRLAVLVYGDGVTYDPEADRLRASQVESKTFGLRPPTIAEMNLPKPDLERRYLPAPAEPQPARVSRPGWPKEKPAGHARGSSSEESQ